MLESDPMIKDLSYIIGRRHLSIDDIQHYMDNPYAMSFLHRSMQDAEKEQREWFEKAMGIRVSAELIHAWAGNSGPSNNKKANQPKPDYAYIPLLMALSNRDFFKHVAESVRLPNDNSPVSIAQGDYHPEPGDGNIVSMRDSDKENWMTFIKNTGIYDPGVMDKAISRAREEKEQSGTQMDSRAGFEDNTSRAEHISLMQKALGVSPLVSPTKEDKFKK